MNLDKSKIYLDIKTLNKDVVKQINKLIISRKEKISASFEFYLEGCGELKYRYLCFKNGIWCLVNAADVYKLTPIGYDSLIEYLETPQYDIKELRREFDEISKKLMLATEQDEYTFLCDREFKLKPESEGGLINPDMSFIILKTLNEGKILQVRHAHYGTAEVYLNPQKNKILVTNNEQYNESNIHKYMCSGSFVWFVKKSEK